MSNIINFLLLNFNEKCHGPGLLTIALEISDEFHGKEIGDWFKKHGKECCEDIDMPEVHIDIEPKKKSRRTKRKK